jgi:hypothetical protein
MASIKRPGIEVTQENVTPVAAISTPNLVSVLVGPCHQIVEAFDDSGVAQSTALAGTYQDGKGTVAYALPDLKTGAVVDTASVRVFRVDGAGASTELRSGDAETTIASGSTGAYLLSSGGDLTAAFTHTGGSFQSSGVQKGDFVRFTYQGDVVDLEITVAPASETALTVVSGIDQRATDEIAGISYIIVRSPAQFVFKSAAEQADVEIGDFTNPEVNYVNIAIKSTAAATLTGAAGDSFKMQIRESTPAYTATHTATGTAVATGTDIGTHFNALNSSTFGPAATTTLGAGAYLLVHKSSATPIGGTALASAVRANTVAGSGEANTVVITAANSMASKQGVVGKIVARSTADATIYNGSRVTLTAHGITDGNVSAGVAYVFIDDGTNGGLYKVTSRVDANTLELDSGGRPSGSITFSGGSGQQVCSLLVATATPAVSLSAGATTIVYDYSASSTAFTVLGGDGTPVGKAIVFGSDAKATAAYNTVTGVSSTGRQYTVTDLASGGSPGGAAVVGGASTRQSQFVTVSFATNFVVPAAGTTYQIELARSAKGETTITGSTLKSNLEAITAFTGSFTIDVVGSPTYTYLETDNVREGQTLAGTHPFDGGVDANNVLLDADLIGSSSATHSIYIDYKALRVDVSDLAGSPALVEINSTADVTTKLGKISTSNPLALAAYFATLQSPGTTVKCLGVSATSTAQPTGTTAAYTTALSYLEGQDVYAIAGLSADPAVQALFKSHVTAMSAPTNKSERIAFVSQDMPTHVTATLLSSGTGGNTTAEFASGATNKTFTTNVDFSLNAALTTVLADTGSDDLILVVSAKSSSTDAPQVANGVLPVKYGVRVNKTATTSAHATDPAKLIIADSDVSSAGTSWNSLINVTWALYKAGAALSTTAQKAAAVADLGSQFADKRMFLVWPNSANASISGSDTVVGGEFLAAAWAAKVGFEKAQKPFTNTKLTGFSGLSNSNTLFSRSQLNSIAGGGVWIMVQDSPASALSCRHQLSTKVDTIQNRELSITKTVDRVAKRLRQVLGPKVGPFRVTQSYLDTLGVITQGELTNFIESGVITSGKVNFVEVDSSSADTVNIQVIISVPFPANYIALTLQF